MDGQFSDDFKAQYRKSYGYSYNSQQPDYTRCADFVIDRYGNRQCSRPNGHGPHGAWCKQHDPDRIKAKREADEARRAEEHAAWRAEQKIARAIAAATAALEPALRQIAAGHNDPRSLAESVIAALDAARATPAQEQPHD